MWKIIATITIILISKFSLLLVSIKFSTNQAMSTTTLVPIQKATVIQAVQKYGNNSSTAAAEYIRTKDNLTIRQY